MNAEGPILTVGSWVFSSAQREAVRIVGIESVWNNTVCDVWIPRLETVERLPAESLMPLGSQLAPTLDRIGFAVCAARIADALTQNVLLAPLEAGVIPLP